MGEMNEEIPDSLFDAQLNIQATLAANGADHSKAIKPTGTSCKSGSGSMRKKLVPTGELT
jgi:hypothetical protein